jgi:hypothetical protein
MPGTHGFGRVRAWKPRTVALVGVTCALLGPMATLAVASMGDDSGSAISQKALDRILRVQVPATSAHGGS